MYLKFFVDWATIFLGNPSAGSAKQLVSVVAWDFLFLFCPDHQVFVRINRIFTPSIAADQACLGYSMGFSTRGILLSGWEVRVVSS